MIKVTEIFRPVVGFPKYEVSTFGRVRSIWYPHKPRFLNCSISDPGYPSVNLAKESCGHKKYRVHRLVAEAFIPNPENKPQVNHKDAVKYHNDVWNLEWVDQVGNSRHAVKMGLINLDNLQRFGEDNSSSKLKEVDVIRIRELSSEGMPCRQIQMRFFTHVSRNTIERVVNGTTWKHVSP